MSTTRRVAVILDIPSDGYHAASTILRDDIADTIADAFAARDVPIAIVNVVVDTRTEEKVRVIGPNTHQDPRLEVKDPNILR